MKSIRVSLFLLALLGVSGWLWLRKPHSPTDDLPPAAYAAFQIHAPTPEAGLALAEAARGWTGVNAVCYNTNSDLLVAIFTPATTTQDLKTQLQALASRRIEQKVFEAPPGPKCPVPHSALSALPGVLLAVGGGSAALLLALLAWPVRRRHARAIPV